MGGYSSKTKLPASIIKQRNATRKRISTGPGEILQEERIHEGGILLYNFDINDSKLKPEHLPILNELAEWSLSDERISIAIEGHASQTGNESDNLILSDDRAQAVHDYLVFNQFANQQQIIDAYGLGSADPIVDNKKIEENLNRSVYVRYSIPVISTSPPASVPTSGTNKWQIKIKSQAGVGLFVGGGVLGGTIRSADPLYVAEKNGYLAAGIAGFDLQGASASIWGGWVDFQTDDIYTIDDFDGTFGIVSTREFSLGIGYQSARLSFPNLGAYNIDIGGLQLGIPGASVAGMYGFWKVQ